MKTGKVLIQDADFYTWNNSDEWQLLDEFSQVYVCIDIILWGKKVNELTHLNLVSGTMKVHAVVGNVNSNIFVYYHKLLL